MIWNWKKWMKINEKWWTPKVREPKSKHSKVDLDHVLMTEECGESIGHDLKTKDWNCTRKGLTHTL